MKRTALAVVTAALIVAFSPSARAHPLGNFTVNRYAGLVVAPERVTIAYVLDLAEIPAFQELRRLDPDGAPGRGALQRWAEESAAELVRGLVLRVDGARADLRVDAAAATTASGQGGLPTLRLDATFWADLPAVSGTLTFEDRNDPGRLGWRELTARGAGGVALVGSTIPAASATDRLRSYPTDLLSSPLDVTRMEAGFRPGGAVTAPGPTNVGDGPLPTDPGGGFVDLVDRRGPLVLLGVLLAFGLGAWHALLPGHGKTLMAAAIVAANARSRQAVVAAISVAAMHTLSVIGLGVGILLLEQTFRPETLYPWLRMAAGAAAVGVGTHLVRRRWRARRRRHDGQGAEDDPNHGSDGHVHDAAADGLLSRRGIAALALAGGILPSPSALVVLLAAIQAGRAGYGLGLVLAFSLGLAASLVLVGFGAIRARRIRAGRAWHRAIRVVPLGSAAAVVMIGLYVTVTGVAAL